jgi:cytochrome c oxidase assembly factor CtaG
VYAFLLPPSMLAPLARSEALRSFFRTVRLPWVAAGIWLATLYAWHFAFAYEGALDNPVVHALQHQAFLLAALLFWLVALEPNRRRVPGGLWKIAYIGGTRFAGMFLGMALVASTATFYDGFYGRRALEHGMTPIEDQQLAGGMMLSLDLMIVIGSLFFFFMRTAEDAEREERAEASRAPGPKLG